MEEGQAQEQPSMDSVAEAILQDEGVIPPRDEKGKFTSNNPPEAKAQETTEPPAEEVPEVEEASPPRKLKLNYKGEEKEVEETEAIELAQKGFDYTQKTQALAKEREELQAKVRQETESRKSEYEKQLKVYEQAVLKFAEREAFGVDLMELSKTDPAKAQELFFRQQQFAQTISQIQSEQQRLNQEREATLRDEFQKKSREAIEVLQVEIPGWSDDLYGKILKFGVDVGFKPEEVNLITDPRAIKVLNDARLYRESKAKPVTEKRVAAPAPKVLKPGAAKENDGKDKWKSGMDKLKKTGKADDAVPLMDALLEREGAFR